MWLPTRRSKRLYYIYLAGKENRIGVCSYNPYYPDYSTISRGLNYEGKCLNETCSLYEKVQIIKKGYGQFDFLIEKDKCYCYYCVRPIVITELCFLKSTYAITAVGFKDNSCYSIFETGTVSKDTFFSYESNKYKKYFQFEIEACFEGEKLYNKLLY